MIQNKINIIINKIMETVNNHVKELTNEGFYNGWITTQNQNFLSNDIRELENWSIFMEDISNENENEENENENDENDKKKKKMKIVKKKIQKPKNAIKRPPSAYLVFCSEMRPTVKYENPNIKPQDIIKNLAFRWRELEDKSKYIDIASDRKAEYLIVKDQHDQNNDDEIAPVKVKLPRKSKSKATGSKSKSKTVEDADQDCAREDIENSQYGDDIFETNNNSDYSRVHLTTTDDDDDEDNLPLRGKSHAKSFKKTIVKSEKASDDDDDIPLKKEKKISAYTIFCRKNREKIKKQNESSTGRQIVKIINSKWAQLSDDKKQKYIDLAASST